MLKKGNNIRRDNIQNNLAIYVEIIIKLNIEEGFPYIFQII